MKQVIQYTKTFVFGYTAGRALNQGIMDNRTYGLSFEGISSGFYLLGFGSAAYWYDDTAVDVYLNEYVNNIAFNWLFNQTGNWPVGDNIPGYSIPTGDNKRMYLEGNEKYDWWNFPIPLSNNFLNFTANIVYSNYAPAGTVYYRMGGYIAVGFEEEPQVLALEEIGEI